MYTALTHSNLLLPCSLSVSPKNIFSEKTDKENNILKWNKEKL